MGSAEMGLEALTEAEKAQGGYAYIKEEQASQNAKA